MHMLENLDEFVNHLRSAVTAENAQFCIVYHINPDGDCIGSAYALALILRAAGAKTAVCGHDPVPGQFRSLTDGIPMDSLDPQTQYIAVDCKDRKRTGLSFTNNHYSFWIDHHGSDFTQADHEYVQPNRSACSELILEIAEMLSVAVTKQIAELLYTALVTDTSRFCTPSTNADSIRTAAKLAQCGIDLFEIGRRYTQIKTKNRLNLERRIFSKMHLLCNEQLAAGLITLKDLHDENIDSQNSPDLQNINNLFDVVATARITVVIREYPLDNPEGQTRFSIKSFDSAISAKAIAEHFGGGGHLPAAGGFRKKEPALVLKEIEQYCARLLTAK